MSLEAMGVAAFVAFLLAAFFAGSETGIIAINRIRLRHLAEKGNRRAKLVLEYANNPEYFFSIVLVGTNLGVIGCTSAFTGIMIAYFGEAGDLVATAILVPALLVLEEIIPKAIYLNFPQRSSMLSIYPLKFFAVVLYPVIKTFSAVSNAVTRLFGIGHVEGQAAMTMEELLFHLRDSREAGVISADTMTLVSRAIEMLDFSAKDVMTPLDRVVMVPEGLSLDGYQDVFARERFSRLPVYRGRHREVVGIVSIHNLLKARRPQGDELVLEPLYKIRTDAPIGEVMIRMKSHGYHMALVADTSDQIIGMTTLEDILERLVGAIADEFH